MAASIFGRAIPIASIGAIMERTVLTKLIPSLFEPSSAGFPKAVGLTISALAASGFWLTMYGFFGPGADFGIPSRSCTI